MPSLFKSLRIWCMETLFLIGFFVVVSHLCINLWERWMIHADMSHVKLSLHSLKEAVANMNGGYTNIYQNRNGQNKNQYISTVNTALKYQPSMKDKSTLNTRDVRDLQTQAMLRAKTIAKSIEARPPILKHRPNQAKSSSSLLKIKLFLKNNSIVKKIITPT